MNKPKQFYEAPEAETLVVRFEGCILTGSRWDTATPNVDWGDDVDL